jgi:hypothetical protein
MKVRGLVGGCTTAMAHSFVFIVVKTYPSLAILVVKIFKLFIPFYILMMKYYLQFRIVMVLSYFTELFPLQVNKIIKIFKHLTDLIIINSHDILLLLLARDQGKEPPRNRRLLQWTNNFTPTT